MRDGRRRLCIVCCLWLFVGGNDVEQEEDGCKCLITNSNEYKRSTTWIKHAAIKVWLWKSFFF